MIAVHWTFRFASIFLYCFCLFLIFPILQKSSSATALAFMDRSTDCTYQSFSCFSNKYGFGSSPKPYTFTNGTITRMAEIKPFAIEAANAYNNVAGHDKVEPQMLVWWAVYDTSGVINYNNCNDQGYPRGSSYFKWNTNCNNTWLWQLGYGAQFSHVSTLKPGFASLYGDPNNASLVQQVGQAVLNFDKTIPTSPACGGYSCTFPKKTISQILSGVVINKEGSPLNNPLPQDNWWASVLLRDPALNAYDMADILTVDIINKNTVCGWRGDYCSAWGGVMTDSFAQVVKMWDSIPNTGISLPGNPQANSFTGSLIGNPDSFPAQFSQPGGKYYDYYQFAANNLFDGLNFFTSSSGATFSTGNTVSDYAKQLEAAILRHCPTQQSNLYGTFAVVNRSNYGCVQTAAFKSEIGQYADAVVQRLVDSVLQNTNLQCVGFARAVSAGIGKEFTSDQSQADNKYYTWIPIGANKDIPGGVKIGDIAHFGDGVGHVGIVTSIDPNHRGFGLTEANGNCLSGHCSAYPAGRVDTTNPHNYIYDGNFDGVLRLK